MTLFEQWRPVEFLPDIPPNITVAVDIETKDDGIAAGIGSGWPWDGGFVVGVAAAWQQDGLLRSIYLPLRHELGGNLDTQLVMRWLQSLFRNNLIVVMNGAYDFGWLGMIPKRFFDVAIAAPLLDEYMPSYSLNALAKRWLGETKATDDLVQQAVSIGYRSANEVMSNMHRLPAWLVDSYARKDAELTLRLADVLRTKLEEEDLSRAFRIETELLPIIIGMRRQGIRIDERRIEILIKKYRNKIETIQKRFKELIGRPIAPWVADEVADALQASGVKVPKTEKSGAPSIRRPWLQALADQGNETAALVLQLRQADKVLNTFLEGYFSANVRKGRVFPEFYSLRADRRDGASYGTVSYRFSCSHPNFQNLPGRESETTRDIRGLVLPEEGELWIAGDYSQQEPRLALHYACTIEAPGASEARQRMLAAGDAWDFHSDTATIVGLPRKQVKAISLGRMYGAGGASIAKLLGLPTVMYDHFGELREGPGEKAAELLRRYDEKFPWIRFSSEFFARKAQSFGYLSLLGGYQSRFATKDRPNADRPSKAFNRLVQGSAAVQIKAAMIRYVNLTGRYPLITLHDEIGVSGFPDTEGKRLVEALESVFSDKLTVPFRADIAVGKNWGAAALGDES